VIWFVNPKSKNPKTIAMLSSKRVALLWTLLILSGLGVAASLVAAISGLSEKSSFEYDEGDPTAFLALCFITVVVCAALCCFPLRILHVNEEATLKSLTPFWIINSIAALICAIVTLIIGNSSSNSDDTYLYMSAGMYAGVFASVAITA
jgi:hypothetical protein